MAKSCTLVDDAAFWTFDFATLSLWALPATGTHFDSCVQISWLASDLAPLQVEGICCSRTIVANQMARTIGWSLCLDWSCNFFPYGTERWRLFRFPMTHFCGFLTIPLTCHGATPPIIVIVWLSSYLLFLSIIYRFNNGYVQDLHLLLGVLRMKLYNLKAARIGSQSGIFYIDLTLECRQHANRYVERCGKINSTWFAYWYYKSIRL